MRIRMISITQVLPALLILAMAASTQAQTSSLNGFSANGERQSDNPSKSRYRLVPTQKQQAATLSSRQLDRRSLQLDRSAQTPELQPTTRVAVLLPAKDISTSPGRVNPAVDASAFHPAAYETPTIPDNYGSPEAPYFNPAATGNSVSAQVYVDPSVAQPHAYQLQQVSQMPTELAYEVSDVPMNRNFFGVDRDACCDEWNGFIACGGLKANPGHYGQPFIVGCDPCEPPCGRCSKCLVDKHKSKKANRAGCQNGACERCNQCKTDGKKSCGIKARAEKQKPDCGCASCTAGKGGLLGWLK